MSDPTMFSEDDPADEAEARASQLLSSCKSAKEYEAAKAKLRDAGVNPVKVRHSCPWRKDSPF